MVNNTNFYEVGVKREQIFRIPIGVANGISKEDAMTALDDFNFESHVENECWHAHIDVEVINLIESNKQKDPNVEDFFRKMKHSTDGALIILISRNENGKEEVVTKEYEKKIHGQLLFGDDFS